jgi:hypothetical protein
VRLNSGVSSRLRTHRGLLEIQGFLSGCGVRRCVGPGTTAKSWMLRRRTANTDAVESVPDAAGAGIYSQALASSCSIFGGLSVRIWPRRGAKM